MLHLLFEAISGTVGRILTFQKAKLIRILFANDLDYIQSSEISIKCRKPPEKDYMEDIPLQILYPTP